MFSTVEAVCSERPRALRLTPDPLAEGRMERCLYYANLLAQLRRSSRRSVRPVRRPWRRSWRPVRRSPRRSMPEVWAPARDAVRTATGAARPSAAANPTRESARRREIVSLISLMVITPALEPRCRLSGMRTCRHGQNRHLPSVSGAPPRERVDRSRGEFGNGAFKFART